MFLYFGLNFFLNVLNAESLELLPDNKYGAKFICLDDDYHFDPQNWDDEKYLDDLIDEFFNYIDYNFDEWV